MHANAWEKKRSANQNINFAILSGYVPVLLFIFMVFLAPIRSPFMQIKTVMVLSLIFCSFIPKLKPIPPCFRDPCIIPVSSPLKALNLDNLWTDSLFIVIQNHWDDRCMLCLFPFQVFLSQDSCWAPFHVQMAPQDPFISTLNSEFRMISFRQWNSRSESVV